MGDAAPPPNTVNLVVKDQNQHEIQFRVKKTTKFQKIFDAYCTKKGVAINTLRFMFDGQFLRPEGTPEEFDMEDGDSIDAMIEQVGGCSAH